MNTKKLLLVGSKQNGTKNSVHDIARLLQDQPYQITVIFWEDLIFNISKNTQSVTADGIEIAENFDLVIGFNWYKTGRLTIYRDVALTFALYLQHNNVDFWNNEMAHQRSTTKLSMMMQLAINDIDIPKTTYSLDARQLAAVNGMVFPCIIKGMAASRGAENYLVKDSQELQKIVLANEVNKYLVQEFIANDSDLRLVCAAGAPVMAIERKRTNADTHLNNTSQGASARQIEIDTLPPELLTKTEKICRITGRELAGVDWMLANDGSDRKVCLEVNAIPQISSGTYVETKIEKIGDRINQFLDKENI